VYDARRVRDEILGK